MQISISINSVTTLIYARIALDRTAIDDPASADTLSPDRSVALRAAITGSFPSMISPLIHMIEDVAIPDPDDPTSDLILMSVRAANNLAPGLPTLLRRKIEDALAMATLAMTNAATDSDAFGRYMSLAQLSTDEALAMLTGTDIPGTIPAYRL